MLILSASNICEHNYTQSLGHVDQPLQEDSKVLFREQGGYRKHCQYTYSGWA